MTIPTDTPNIPARAPRHDGWTERRKRLFFETLAAGQSVAMGCARAGLSRQAAYAARRRDPDFAREWRAAQAQARRKAERDFLDRLPEPLRQALLQEAAPDQSRRGRFFAQDRVKVVKPW